MLFNSYNYLFLFLPSVVVVYFLLNNKGLFLVARSFLVIASLSFYSWWNPAYLPLILISIIVNYAIGQSMVGNGKIQVSSAKIFLYFGICFNLSLLAYFKYFDFFLENFNLFWGFSLQPLQLMLPLAISFFTFQQIAYLMDSYNGKIKEFDLLNYCLFVTFFPQLIAGPIVHHKEMMPQFASLRAKLVNWQNIYRGLFIFSLGLFKKVVIADTFSNWVTVGFDRVYSLNFFEAWFTTLSYTLQIYFDFSGYTDMAIGSALLFNIRLPINFNSPYKALNIQDFWRRWHITLSRWLKDYIYIPLGGNRNGEILTYRNLFITFLLGGLWHGAGWPFIIWGLLHGVACCLHKLWLRLGFRLSKYLSWFLTFLFINLSWVFFRAKDLESATALLRRTLGLEGVVFPKGFVFAESMGFESAWHWMPFASGTNIVLTTIICLVLVLFLPNSQKLGSKIKPTWCWTFLVALIWAISIPGYYLKSEFLYFNF